ncbi:MAG TPA: hypothetical protein VNO52_12090 [Methylomirabilota bacterium]|nr:hypothetical protein [Methylomirabilota bacterium]
MRMGLHLSALGVALLTLALWFFGGMNTGWTKTSVPVDKVDAVTGLTYQEWEHRFLPGLDFLGAGLILAAVLVGAGFLFPRGKS